jgi:hypothetical protein
VKFSEVSNRARSAISIIVLERVKSTHRRYGDNMARKREKKIQILKFGTFGTFGETYRQLYGLLQNLKI